MLKCVLFQLEPLIAAGAFNEAGGLQFSRVIERSLVDVFVPFLPLERSHVKTCVRNELQRRGIVAGPEVGHSLYQAPRYCSKDAPMLHFVDIPKYSIYQASNPFQVVEKVTDQLSYWPRDIKLYSSSGCKRVAQKIDLIVEEMEEEEGGQRNEL